MSTKKMLVDGCLDSEEYLGQDTFLQGQSG